MIHRPCHDFRTICEVLQEESRATLSELEELTGIPPYILETALQYNPQTFKEYERDTYGLTYYGACSIGERRSDYYRMLDAYEYAPNVMRSAYEIADIAVLPIDNVAHVMVTRPDTFKYYGMSEDEIPVPVASYIK